MSEVLRIVIRIPKKYGALVYFYLEANDGLCFYSTLGGPCEHKGSLYRDIEIQGPGAFAGEVEDLIRFLGDRYPVEILSRSKDSARPQAPSIGP